MYRYILVYSGRFFLLMALFLIGIVGNSQNKWIAPKSANSLLNPVKDSPQAVLTGNKLYKSLCVACHGVSGRGDGIAAAGLSPKPANFYDKNFTNQTDGAIFWKLSKGRGVMAGYETMLSEEDRWALVTYLKSLHKATAEKEPKIQKNENRIKNTFLFTQLINSQTVQVLPKNTSEFTIQHRFGPTALDAGFIDQFMGMDLSSNIRFAYAMAINDRMYAEIGRTKFGKVYDLGIKYLYLRQTTDNTMPVSLAVYSNIGVMTDKFPAVVAGSTFEDGRDFKYLFAHRLTYDFQLILARKFSDNFSLQLNTVFIWHNLVSEGANNLVMAFPIGGRVKLNSKTALLFEATPVVNTPYPRIPLSLSYEIASSSAHVFQLIVTSTDRILESAVYTQPVYDYTKAKFVLGFNIKRLF